jgi:CDP-diacylglycerol--glycerol-3-phosphate 3-phosphatidyltransferase
MTRDEAVRFAGALTMARLALAPVIAGLLLWASAAPEAADGARLAGLILFVLAAVTDLADGWVARRFGAQTALGAALDHAADKVLTSAVLIGLSATVWPVHLAAVAIVLILRDVLVAGLREGLAQSGRALPVDTLGKWKAAALMAGLFFALLETALLAWPPSGVADGAYLAAHGCLVIALGLSLWSAGGYVRRALRPDAA